MSEHTTKPRAFYFGCWNEAGHYMFPSPKNEFATRDEQRRVERFDQGRVSVDGTLAPRRLRHGTRAWRTYDGADPVWTGLGQSRDDIQRIEYDSEEYKQGQFVRHDLDTGYTAIAWWDRNQGDLRDGCSSTFFYEGLHTSDEMVAAFREHFPHVAANIDRAGIHLVDVTPKESP